MLLRRPISPRAYAEPCLGSGWEECKRGRSGGVRVERSPAPRSVPGFACHPLARSAAENSIITAGESGDWERKIRDPATLVAHARPRRSIPNTHTFFPGLGKSPKAAPSADTQTLPREGRTSPSLLPSNCLATDSSFAGRTLQLPSVVRWNGLRTLASWDAKDEVTPQLCLRNL